MIKYFKTTDNIATLSLDMSDRTVNVINHEIAKAFVPVVAHLEKERARNALSGVIITSEKKTFLAGGDIDYLFNAHNPQEIYKFIQTLKEVIRGIERLGVPVVAAINGSAIGSGFEMALACHYRICIDEPHTRVQLPEITFGLLSGGGGSVRMLWKFGIEKAYRLLTESRDYRPKEALAEGLVDELVKTENDLTDRARKWILANPNAVQTWDIKDARLPDSDPRSLAGIQRISTAIARMQAHTRNHYPAYEAIANVLVESSLTDFETAMRIESRYFAGLVMGQTSKNMMQALWYDRDTLRKGSQRPAGFAEWRPRKVGVLGAGQMGRAIAYLFAIRGIEVILKDISAAHAEQAKAYSEDLLKRKVEENARLGTAATQVLNYIHPTDNYADLEGCDLVIEAVSESLELKHSVLAAVAPYLTADTLFATNTSTIPIGDLANDYPYPTQFIGLRFFAPAEKIKFNEIICSPTTSPESLARALDVVELLRNVAIVVKESTDPDRVKGFFTARLTNAYISEALRMLLEGVPAAMVENIGKQAGMEKAPLALLDELSLPLFLRTQSLAFNAAKPEAAALVAFLEGMLANARIGRGTWLYPANGCYNYENTDLERIPTALWEGLSRLQTTHQPDNNTPDDTTTKAAQQDLTDRLLFIQVIEAMHCLQEGLIVHDAAANFGSIFGCGFPAFKGGTMQFIKDYGPTLFRRRAADLTERYGPRFAIPNETL